MPPAAPLLLGFCHRHADRKGIARCMACTAIVCQECATRFDGINYCAQCLARTRGGSARRAGLPALVGTAIGACVALPLAGVALGWALLLWSRAMR